MKTIKNILSILGLIVISGFLIFAAQKSPDKNFDEEIGSKKQTLKDKDKSYNVYAIEVPMNLDFAGEKLPLHNPDIYERMDLELLKNTYWQSNGLLLLKRANKYFPIIEPILKANGIPEDFKYLAVAESGLTNAVSPAGARGFWQIMETTGRENGLEVNKNVDERYHLEKATKVACNYLKEAKAKFGTWTLAAASYNAGKAGIANKLKAQGVKDYYDLALVEETGRYLFRIVALKEILSNPKKYGFNFNQKDLYSVVDTKTIKVDMAISDLASYAKDHGINYKLLKIHNPWLRQSHLNNKSKKVYEIKIPLKGIYK